MFPCRWCTTCQKINVPHGSDRVQPIVSKRPFERWICDLKDFNAVLHRHQPEPEEASSSDDSAEADELKNDGSYRYMFAVIDHFSSFVWCRPLRGKSAKEVCCAA
jgi:hypothetical protein